MAATVAVDPAGPGPQLEVDGESEVSRALDGGVGLGPVPGAATGLDRAPDDLGEGDAGDRAKVGRELSGSGGVPLDAHDWVGAGGDARADGSSRLNGLGRAW